MTKLRRRILREATWLLAASVLLTFLWLVECVRMFVGPPHARSGWLLILLLAAVVLIGYRFYMGHRWTRGGVPIQWSSSSRWLWSLQLIPALLGFVVLLLSLWEDLAGQPRFGSDEAVFLLMLAMFIGAALDFYHYRRWLLRLP